MSSENSLQISEVRYLVISDIHFGNRRNPAWRIANNLWEYIEGFKDLDILFIAGDVFDKEMWFHSDDVPVIVNVFLKLYSHCEENSIKLRVLKGTDIHERGQFKTLAVMAKKFERLDFRYIGEVEVEYFQEYNLSCLYVPDNHLDGGKLSQEHIRKTVLSSGRDKVHIAIVHSWFNHHLPEIHKESCYDEEFFLSLVEFFISNGHIHIPQMYLRIITQGSFDRIAHNEDHPKGGVLFHIKGDESTWCFVQNTNALPFKTLKLASQDVDKCFDQVNKLVRDLPEYSWVSIRAKESHPFYHSVEELGRRYPLIRFEKKALVEKEQKLISSEVALKTDYTVIGLFKENIVDKILEEMTETDKSALRSLRNKLEALL